MSRREWKIIAAFAIGRSRPKIGEKLEVRRPPIQTQGESHSDRSSFET